MTLGVEYSRSSGGGLKDLADVQDGAAILDKKSDGESDEEEINASASQGFYVTRRSALDEATCDARGRQQLDEYAPSSRPVIKACMQRL